VSTPIIDDMRLFVEFFASVPGDIVRGFAFVTTHPTPAAVVVGSIALVVASGMLHVASWRRKGI